LGFAILYRTNAQSRILEEALRKKNIPYQIFGGISFYQRKEIKDLLAYFRLILNPNDDESFKRIINYPKRGIGDATLDKLSLIASNNSVSIWQAASHLNESNLGLSSAVQSKILAFMSMIWNFKMTVETLDAFEMARQIAVSSGILKELYNNKSPEEISRYENIQELLNGIKDFTVREKQGDDPVTLGQFVENVALLTNEDRPDEENGDKLTMMTIHSAKGLEFKHVFLAGLEEELFPSKFSVNTIAELEEERRLFYVAITRAESSLTISYARTRYRWGQLSDCQPSRFIRDIPSEFFDELNISVSGSPFTSFKKSKTIYDNSTEIPDIQLYGNKQLNFKKKNLVPLTKKTKQNNTLDQNQANSEVQFSASKFTKSSDLEIGSQVLHERFGTGKVIALEGNFPETKATIEFENSGKKQILLKFAKLNIISK
jgi:DNA helicase-2/ATP-dependent DNA helicase PcrA